MARGLYGVAAIEWWRMSSNEDEFHDNGGKVQKTVDRHERPAAVPEPKMSSRQRSILCHPTTERKHYRL